MKVSLRSIFIVLIFVTTFTTFSYAEKRQHLAHMHGHGLLNIATTENQVHIELNSPAESLLGFEHHAETDEQHQKVISTNKILKNGGGLFVFPQKAQCHLLSALIDTPMLEEDNAEHHDEHDAEHHDEHHSEHNDIRVQYQFECENPNHLSTITTTLFNHFPRFEELDVQLLTPQGTNVLELDKALPNIHLQ